MSDFFIKTGFLKPINREIDDYGIGLLQITQAQIDETIAYIQSKNYSAPVSPVIHYISAHSIDIFKNQLPLSGQTGVGVSLNGQYLTIQHSEWQNAVAFETYNANNELIFASIRGSGNLSNQTSKVYFPTFAQKVYAVGFDGHRILVYPTGMANQEIDAQSDLKIYPNPIQNNQNLKIELQNVKGIYQLGLLNLEGRKLYSENGILAELESKLNQKLAKLKSGIYVLILKDTNGKTFEQKIIKK